MVINAKGKIFPENTGPVPSMKRDSAGIASVGRTARIPRARRKTVPSLMKVLR
jgi:hypothetical protein